MAMTTPRMAASKSFGCKAQSLKEAIFLKGLDSILTAGGRVPATARKQRGNRTLIQTYEQNRQFI